MDTEPGATYTITISHKNSLARGSQAYSLIVSGVGGAGYCKTSAPTVANGARIDSISFGGIQKLNSGLCTGYNNFTNITGTVEPNSTMPLYVRVNACAGGAVDKIVRAWIDFNNDGDFDDAGELVGTSPVINGDGVGTLNVSIPANLTADNYGVLRVIVQETANAGDVAPCGAYGKGQTQDYRLRFSIRSNDVGVTTITAPYGTGCANATQYVTVRLKNFGASAKSNITLAGTVKEGANLITTLSGTYAPTLNTAGEAEYTFPGTFASAAGKTYTINVKAVIAGDQQTDNDEQTITLAVKAAPANPIAQAEICNNEQVFFNATNAGTDLLLWYETGISEKSIATGSPTSSTVIRADKTYYVGKNDQAGKAGPATRDELGAGGYNSFVNNFVKFTNLVPLTIDRARLYIGAPGKIEFTLADLGTVTGTQYTYNPLYTTTINVYATGTSPTDDPGAVFALNIPVPVAGDHIIIIRCLEGATIYRNNSGTQSNPYPYPFTIPNVFSITGNNAVDNSTTPDPNYYQRFYYFFYDMRVSLDGCPSSRVPVVATIPVTPVIILNDNVFTSNVASGNQWYVDGTLIPGATGQTHTATVSGKYQSIIPSALGCQSRSNEINFAVTGIPNIDPSEIGLKVMPNPNDGRFMLDFSVSKKADLAIMIVNAIGQRVFTSRTPGFIGRYTRPVDAGKLAPGVYLLQVQHDHKSYLKKLVVR